MSTITIINSGDVLEPTSRTNINTNFSNLNTDKLEVNTIASVTGKTFDTATNVLKINGTVISSITSAIVNFLASPTSSNLATAVTDETGSGPLVFGTNPTIVKPILNATNPTAQTYTPLISSVATLDLSLANEHRITMPAGNITVAISNDTNSQKFLVSTTQDSSGSRTVTWFPTIKWAGGSPPTLTTTANKTDILGFIRVAASSYWGMVVGQNI